MRLPCSRYVEGSCALTAAKSLKQSARIFNTLLNWINSEILALCLVEEPQISFESIFAITGALPEILHLS
jgi:hypothetical protein